MTKENLRLEIKNARLEAAEKAESVDMWYVLCAFISPIDKTVNYRTGLFDERLDAEMWINVLNNRYKELQVPYYIVSNGTDYFWGNIFDADILKEI